jgi:hypothetical protein
MFFLDKNLSIKIQMKKVILSIVLTSEAVAARQRQIFSKIIAVQERFL